jgi:hypothetical protein
MTLQNKILCATFAVFLILFYFINRQTAVEKKPEPQEPATADTFIPAGYVLVPIQIENSDALSAVMGSFALVDLYSDEGGHNTLVAEKVKLIRAPLNPRQFAVLVSESLSRIIMQSKNSFSVVLQNRNVFKADLEKNLLNKNSQDEGGSSGKTLSQNKPGEQQNDPISVSKPLPERIRIEYQQKKNL